MKYKQELLLRDNENYEIQENKEIDARNQETIEIEKIILFYSNLQEINQDHQEFPRQVLAKP